jgi:hypothetical protein
MLLLAVLLLPLLLLPGAWAKSLLCLPDVKKCVWNANLRLFQPLASFHRAFAKQLLLGSTPCLSSCPLEDSSVLLQRPSTAPSNPGALLYV